MTLFPKSERLEDIDEQRNKIASEKSRLEVEATELGSMDVSKFFARFAAFVAGAYALRELLWMLRSTFRYGDALVERSELLALIGGGAVVGAWWFYERSRNSQCSYKWEQVHRLQRRLDELNVERDTEVAAINTSTRERKVPRRPKLS